MQVIILKRLLFSFLLLYGTQVLAATPQDMYPGDSSIYGLTSTVQPNVLILLDTSGSMSTGSIPAGNYDPTNRYPAVNDCITLNTGTTINAQQMTSGSTYVIVTAGSTNFTNFGAPDSNVGTQFTSNHSVSSRTSSSYYIPSGTGGGTVTPITSVPFSCVGNTITNPARNNVYIISGAINGASGASISSSTATPLSNVTASNASCGTTTTLYSSLLNNGYVSLPNRQLAASGSACTAATGTTIYATGNYINYLNYLNGTSTALKAVVAVDVLQNLILNTPNVKFGLMTFNSNSVGGGIYQSTASPASSTTPYWTTVQNMTTPFPNTTSTTTTQDALIAALQSMVADPTASFATNTPTAEMELEAGRYFGNGASGDTCSSGGTCVPCTSGSSIFCGASAFSSAMPPNSVTSGSVTYYQSPMEATCQSNYIIYITDGEANVDGANTATANLLKTMCTVDNASGGTGGCATDGCNDVSTSTVNANSLVAGTSYSVASTRTGSGSTTDFTKCGSTSNTIGTTFTATGVCTGTGKANPLACNAFTGSPPGNDNNGLNNSLPAVAKFLANSTQKITTFTVGFGALTGSDVDATYMLQYAADGNHGKGSYYAATTQSALSKALLQALATIQSENSTFVAPVIPVSPQNRTYGSSRVYMGFFLPETGIPWQGNLKKLGLDIKANTLSYTPTYGSNYFATWVDANADGTDDNTSQTVPSGFTNGSFRSNSQSYWSTSADGGNVAQGGAGIVLENASAPATSRNIYTMASTAATSVLAFNTTNVTPTMLGFSAGDTTDQSNLINFIYGVDAYGDRNNGSTTDNRTWILGDVLHSRPVVVYYASYNPATSGAEASCTTNKTMVYVGGNDGMLHAFRDCDGSEAWAFIPPDELTNLSAIHTASGHPYFVDSSVSTYIYNKSGDGNIDTSTDHVVLIFGEGRGGGSTTAPTFGAYYALDVTSDLVNVTKPSTITAPKLLWTISNATANFGEMAETWSEPTIVKMKVNGSPIIAAVFGAGYDNPHEDGRYGPTQTFSGTASGDVAISNGQTGAGVLTSQAGSGTSPYYTSPKGRGIYVVQIASLSSSGVPTMLATPTLIWSAVYGAATSTTGSAPFIHTDPNLLYSFPTNVSAIDTNNVGYTTRIYAGDTGGRMWRFDMATSSPSGWTSNIIFNSNPGSGTDIGRKIFYPPAVVSQLNYKMLFFGTGDREHPLNTAVTDRMYALKDLNQVTSQTITENNMADVTADQIQGAATVATTVTGTGTDGTSPTVSGLLTELASSNGSAATVGTNYGWFIKLNAATNSGEKVLSSPLVFNKVGYYTTFLPGAAATTNLCAANVGTASLYALNYANGNAAINYNTANDTNATTNPNARNTSGQVLLKADRVSALGTGIPSGVILAVAPNGTLSAVVSSGGNIVNVSPVKGGTVIRLYWRQK
jgi:type IV pilus assembly protein PilY1